MRLKFFTFFIICLNALLVSNVIPYQIIILIIATLALSLISTHKTFRTISKLVLLSVAIIVLNVVFPKLVSTECAVSFVFILAALKAWELDNFSDHFNMFLILILSECGLYLLDSSFLLFGLGLIKMIYYFYYILKLKNYDIAVLNVKRIILLTTPAVLFAIVLFYTFPRFTQGFINSSELQAAYSGASTQFKFSQLPAINPSSETVFKVYGLENSKLNPDLVYWRSHILWDNRKQEWTTSFHNLKGEGPDVFITNLNYIVELQQKIKEFLPTIDGNSQVVSPLPFNYYLEGTRRLKVITRSEFSYQVRGNYGARQSAINDLMMRKGLRIFSDSAEKIRKKVFPDFDSTWTEEKKLKELVKNFKNKNFQYSTSPPSYAGVEDFILKGKEGYCTHFAAAFSFLGRTIGLPTRIVIGYLGGEKNPYDDSILVREMDAHAWTEVYLSDRGWVRIDPTGLVVPARMQMNTRDFYAQLNPYLTLLNIKISRNWFDGKGLRNASLFIDSLNSKLANNVFNLDKDEQAALLKKIRLGNNLKGWPFALSLVLFLLLSYLIFTFWAPQSLSAHEKRYRRFLGKMQKLGVEKLAHETALQFQLRCLEVYPDKRALIEGETDIYLNKFYR